MERSSGDVAADVRAVCASDATAVVAFDGDGTLWGGDVGEDLFHHVLEHVDILDPVDRAARALALAHDVKPRDTAKATLQAMYQAYRADAFPEPEICELMAWCLAGYSRSRAEAIARAVHAPAEMQGRIRPEMRAVLDAMRAANIETFVVSASPALIVEPVAQSLGWDPSHVVALEARWKGDVMQPEAVRPITYDHGKVTNLRARIGARTLAAAFGDSGFDVPLLESARVRVAVRPQPALLARAPEGMVVLQPTR
jgi:HAD superfamily phosphoserine phosphatase-like hydrolase